MIRFESGGTLLEDFSELPQVPDRIKTLYADFETSSGAPDRKSTNPWLHCTAIGAAVAFDDGPIWFVPKRLMTMGWWRDVVAATETWANQNVIYDMHVSANDLNVVPRCRVRCLLTGAKIVNSDLGFQGGYGLDNLVKLWGGRNIGDYEWRMQPYLVGNKDYGNVPIDVLAEYACVDVREARWLDGYIRENMPEESGDVWRTEQAYTSLLFDMEREGLRVVPQEVKIAQYRALSKMIELDETLERLVGHLMNAASSKDCYDVLVNQYGLPVLAWNVPDEEEMARGKTKTPSFDKHALKLYLAHPLAPKDVVRAMLDYRKLSTFNGLFLESFLGELQKDGILHPSYNQCVRTGRMSCSKPNAQQFDTRAKTLIHPPEGMGFICCDGSQIEFRIIAHYIKNQACIDAYRREPWTDFHQLVADMIGIKRKPAKTMNFAMGYGQGKKSTVAALSVNEDFVGDVIAEVKTMGLSEREATSLVLQLCEQRAGNVYSRYHQMLPELKPTSRRAASTCAARGYVRNHYGRRRYLPTRFSHNAFNSLCQSTAGDLVKERQLALREEVPEFVQTAQVHDEVAGFAPLEALRDPEQRLLRRIVSTLNDVARPLDVPMRWTAGWSERHWAEAKSDERAQKFVDPMTSARVMPT